MQHKDEFYMNHALRLAEQAKGTTGKNPAVGCVVVKDNQIISVGKTGQGGRPHAEEACHIIEGSTVYVTLEPCAHKASHDGLSCANRLIIGNVARVVIGYKDPDPRTQGKGIELLENAGITVDTALLRYDIQQLYQGFTCRILYNRPKVTLKLASSLDGKIALADGTSQWITGEHARQHAHLLRLKHDGILIGTNTAQYDQPRLNCRLQGCTDYSPQVFVLDLNKRLDDAYFTANPKHHRITSLQTNQDIAAVLHYIADFGINDLLIEGGGKLAASLLNDNLVDELYWYHAPIIIGNNGLPAVADLLQPDLQQRFQVKEQISWDNGDRLICQSKAEII